MTILPFQTNGPPFVRFGVGAEALVPNDLAECGARRILIVALPGYDAGAQRLQASLGAACVGVYDKARQHVPAETVAEAVALSRAAGIDWVVAHGGGTSTGLAKAIALELDAPDGTPVKIAAVPTTYAGSERTNIYGISNAGSKKTGRDDRVRPSMICYDPALTLDLSRENSLESLFNALAQVMALLADPDHLDMNPLGDDAARQAIPALLSGLAALDANLDDLDARSDALYGAYLAAGCIERSTLGLHHALAHTLGGHYGARHSAAHTAILPYTLHALATRDARLRAALEPALGPDPAGHLYDRAVAMGLPLGLGALGLKAPDLPDCAVRSWARGYAMPSGFSKADLSALLMHMLLGERPS